MKFNRYFSGTAKGNSVRSDEKLSHHTDRGFSNPSPRFAHKTAAEELNWILRDRRRGQRLKKRVPVRLESVENDGAFLRVNRKVFTVTWAGHSSVLVQLGGLNILMDPVWSDRASPVPFIGPRRYVGPGIAFDDLPPIDVVAISHNHYDHFDRATVRRLRRGTLFLVPLGFGRSLRRLGIVNYRELDWWQRHRVGGVEFVSTPAQHYSRRKLCDRDKTLWCSWVFRGAGRNVYFAGDTGYFPGFREIGRRFGSFDLVCLPIGAYLPREYLEHVHMGPEEAIMAYRDLRGRAFLPIHWGTFNLGNDHPHLAMEVLNKEIERHDLDRDLFLTLKHGETRLMDSLEHAAN